MEHSGQGGWLCLKERHAGSPERTPARTSTPPTRQTLEPEIVSPEELAPLVPVLLYTAPRAIVVEVLAEDLPAGVRLLEQLTGGMPVVLGPDATLGDRLAALERLAGGPWPVMILMTSPGHVPVGTLARLPYFAMTENAARWRQKRTTVRLEMPV